MSGAQRRRRHSQSSSARRSPYPNPKHRAQSTATDAAANAARKVVRDSSVEARSVFERSTSPEDLHHHHQGEIGGDDDDETAAAAGSTSSPSAPLNPHVEPFVPRDPASALLHRQVDRLRNPAMLPVQPSIPRTVAQKESTRRLIVVLERACLETYKVSSSSGPGGQNGKKEAKYALLNCDDHQGALAKMNRDIADARPDITHQCLLTLLDSPLNKAGRLQVYIHTTKGVLIEVNPHVRIPRTFKRFSGLMGAFYSYTLYIDRQLTHRRSPASAQA